MDCVHFEHTGSALTGGHGRIGAEPGAVAAPMSPHRLLICLAVLGWTERELARRTGRQQTAVRRWIGHRSPVPADVAAWLETLTAFHETHPTPAS